MAKRIENGETKPTHEEIAQRARLIYERGGRVPGHDLDNWLQAETELQEARKSSSTSRPERREPVSMPGRPMAPGGASRETSSRTQ